MKKFFTILGILILVLVFVGTAVFLFNKSKEKPVVYETSSPFITDIIQKTVATGKVIPRKEVNVTSQVSGVVDQLFVDAGDTVAKGDIIAKISLAPNMIALNNAESQLESAKISLSNAERELERQKNLKAQRLVSESEYNKFLLDFELKKERVKSAENNLLLIREGSTLQSDLVSNIIKATSDGMILQIPNKEGAFIVESSTFGSGTTVATLADMNDMIFEGMVDEAEVGKIREGMELLLDIGALDSEPFQAELEYISPKGQQDQGTIKFQIRAAVKLQDQVFLRANYSANADIVLDKREQVLAINEGNLIFEEGAHFVDVETAPQQFERRQVETGLSDGINIEIVSGLVESDKIKQL
ncbi:efflux RND transporter periplasmic adaptor subunit [Gilvimarinus sp. SDUM040013]|uniref:Efflux RND transporter periplasmic adaptor subunit n=1 Tax=Gilvimarinus gilvus TaxID=3058038 RepID=A0ABU4RXB4_9GAMM|nr:efflux RND transporter periplasmic adaptor subunit [Gilvimarinus sp. SDUM040013]MDO3388645.1 efflux RND transporter periplasmic adaptor subunit [Gilvimarinus sp. SDUM040013]MDX6849540.1 efflux RND transporter periplasmic adaptor subunit [Gilvimarinus sp. SDUM040013]